MKKHCISVRAIIATLLTAASLTGCGTSGQNGSASGSSDSTQNTSDSGGGAENVSVPEIPTGNISVPELPDSVEGITGGTYITLSDNGTMIDGGGAAVVGSVVTISAAGDYVVTGTLTDGKIVVDNVDTSATEKVRIILNGTAIACSSGAAIYVINSEATKTIIEAAEGSVNLISGGVVKTASDTSVEDAAIFSRKDLKLTGKGTLYVTGVYRGIESKDDLEVEELTLYVAAGDDGLRGKDSIEISSGAITVEAGADGLRTDNTEDEGKGYIAISGGSIAVNASDDAIQSVTDLTISGGEFALISGGGSVNAPSKTSGDGFLGFGGGSSQDDSSVSGKAVKAAGNITVSGGTFNIDSADDAFHSDSSLSVTAGTMEVTAGDDGFHSEKTLDISGGTIIINGSYEGIEAAAITVSGGTITVTSSDDGFNSVMGAVSTATASAASASSSSSTIIQTAGGRGGMGGGGMSGGGGFGGGGMGGMDSDDGSTVTISGGTITINADGDGLDCNGSMTITGGYTIVYGPTGDNNGAIDYNGSFTMDGGTLLALGSSGMAQSSSSDSKLAKLFFTASGSANQTLTIADSSGNVLITVTSPKKFACVFFSSPNLDSGTSYTVSLGASSDLVKAS